MSIQVYNFFQWKNSWKLFISGRKVKEWIFRYWISFKCHLNLKGNQIKSVLHRQSHRQSSSVLQINYKSTQTQQGCAKPALSSQDYRFRHTPHLVPKPAQAEKLHRSLCQEKSLWDTDGACRALKSCTVSPCSAESHCCLSCTTGWSAHLALPKALLTAQGQPENAQLWWGHCPCSSRSMTLTE